MNVVKIIATVQLALSMLWIAFQSFRNVGTHELEHPGKTCQFQAVSAFVGAYFLIETGILIFLIA